MKIKTSELIGPALDWLVAKCEGLIEFGPPAGRTQASEFLLMHRCDDMNYSTDWSQGGPIIERSRIDLAFCLEPNGEDWYAVMHDLVADSLPGFLGETVVASESGPTPLIAAMRCYVSSKLGDEVEIPKELL